jgi:hypothetical protein
MCRRELRIALDDIGLNITAAQLETMFQSADLDKNGLIDYREFKTLIYSLQSLDAQWTNERLKRCAVPPVLLKILFIQRQKADSVSRRPKSWIKQDVEPLVDALIFEPIPYRYLLRGPCPSLATQCLGPNLETFTKTRMN